MALKINSNEFLEYSTKKKFAIKKKVLFNQLRETIMNEYVSN